MDTAARWDALLAQAGAPWPLDAFALVRRIGAGGMGEVWLARHRERGHLVAIKFVTAEQAALEACQEALSREIRVAAALDHPNVARLYDTGRVDAALAAMTEGHLPEGAPFLVMEFAAGGSLAPWCGRLPWPDVRALLLELLDGLAHAHARGLVHLDIKPENVLLATPDAPRGVRLADFGLARALTSGDDGVVAGTPAYMAPEQCTGSWRRVGTWTDLYAVGGLGWALLAGEPPFAGEDARAILAAQVALPLPALRSTAPVPAEVERWLRTLLRKDPGARFQRAADAIAALRALPDGGVAAGPGLPAAAPTTRGRGAATTFLWAASPPSDPTSGDPSAPEGTAGAGLPEAEAPEAASVAPERAPAPQSWRALEGSAAAPFAPALRLLGIRQQPMVGRDAERDRLWEALRRVGEGAHLVVLEGPAGVGKSRLARWLVERAHQSGAATVLQSEGEGIGVERMLARFLRVEGASGVALEAHAARSWAIVASSAPFDAGTLAEALDPRSASPSRLDIVASAVARLSAVRPVVVHLEDVHAGSEALVWVRRLLQAHGDAAVLVVATARDDLLAERPDALAGLAELVAAGQATRLAVAPLDRGAAREMLAGLVLLDPDLADEVVARAAGHPQFLTELVSDAAHRGSLVASGESLALAPGARLELPDDLHAAWARRAQALVGADAEALTALELAAVLGPVVHEREWGAACAAARVVAPPGLVGRLFDSRLALPVGGAGGFLWVQAMLRESVLRGAADAGRLPALHGWAAEGLSTQAEAAGRRGLHLLRAGLAAEALEPLVAGLEALGRHSDLAHADALMAAWEEAVRASAIPEDDPAVLPGLLAIATAQRSRGDTIRQIACAERALAMARVHLDAPRTADALLLLGHGLRIQRRLEEAHAALSEALAIARELGSDGLIARARHILGVLAVQQGRLDEADAHYRDALARGRLSARYDLAMLLRRRGDLEASEAMFLDLLAEAHARGDRSEEAGACNALGALQHGRGDVASAIASYRQAAALLEAVGRLDASVPKINLAYLLVEHGSADEALPLLRDVAARAARTGRGDLVLGALAGELALAVLRPDESWRRLARDVEERSKDVGVHVSILLESAGVRAAEARHPERAAALWELCLAQVVALGDTEAASRLGARLAAQRQSSSRP